MHVPRDHRKESASCHEPDANSARATRAVSVIAALSVEHEVMGVRVPVVVLICQVKQGCRDQAVRTSRQVAVSIPLSSTRSRR